MTTITDLYPTRTPTETCTEKQVKEITEAVTAAKSTEVKPAHSFRIPSELKMGLFPAWRWGKILPGLPIGSQGIAFFPFFRIFEDLVGLVDLLKLLLSSRLFVDIRMVLAGQLTEGLLNFLL